MRKFFCVLIAATLLLSALPLAHATESGGFTHPEIGELIEFTFTEGMPSFTIYGFTQYRVLEPGTVYRGMRASGTRLIHGSMEPLDRSMERMFNSLDGKAKEPVPIVFDYTDALKDYAYQLGLLPVKERIKAMRLLSGFDGPEGYEKLLDIEGFETVDVQKLIDNHVDFTVDIDGKTYPYRVLMFYIEEDDWEQIYYERYCYLQINGEWRLGHITKEYFSDYRARLKYVHGLADTDISALPDAYAQVLRNSNWKMTPSEVASAEGGKVEDDSVVVADTHVFRLPTALTYSFTDSWLSKVEYTLSSPQAYFSAFVSLYIRFYDPITINKDGDMTWSLPDILITLKYDDVAPTITITPREHVENTSVGTLYNPAMMKSA